MGFWVVILVSALIGMVSHKLIPRFGSAVATSFLVSCAAVAISLYVTDTPYLFLALPLVAVATLAISFVVGIPFVIVRYRQFLENERGSTCKKCGYDLRGSVSGFCPECGKSYIGP